MSHLGYKMSKNFPNLPELLKADGYTTGVIGKIHVAPEPKFDYRQTDAQKTYDVKGVARQAGEFIGKAGEKPFFLMVNFFDPHTILKDGKWEYVIPVKGLPEKPVTPDDLAKVPATGPRGSPDHYSAVSRLDTGVGLLLKALKDAGHREDTLVMFISDNGPAGRGKCTMRETGTRIPFMIRWPGRVKAGQVNDDLISSLDIMPTCLEAAGIKPPPNLAGQSLFNSPPRRYLFTEYTSHQPDSYRPARGVRDERYKLIVNLTPGRPPVELYDLQADPDEKQNLAGNADHKATLDRLGEVLERWRRETNDPLLDVVVLRRQAEESARMAQQQAGKSK